MSDEQSFLDAILKSPNDPCLRLVFADWLEERDDPRAELLRLLHSLTQSIHVPHRDQLEERLRELLETGVRPVGPFVTNSIGMKFALIPPGTFMMGSPESELERSDKETQHAVTLTKGFCMGVHPVTQEQFETVMGEEHFDYGIEVDEFGNEARPVWPPPHLEKNLPAERVFWDECQEFINKLRDRDKKAYRLPTEAEWEFSCRAGTATPFYFGPTISPEQANYDGNFTYDSGTKGTFRNRASPVGSFPPNAFGLFDMHGNVWEWCEDLFGDYPQHTVVDPRGPDEGQFRVLRGGSSIFIPSYCRSAFRGRRDRIARRSNDYCGFRLCFFLD